MSAYQQHETELLRCQLDSCRAAADICIAAAREERDRAIERAAIAEVNFRRLIYFAALGWVLFSVLAVAMVAHTSSYHSFSSRASGEVAASPAFSEVTK